ncbi:a-pheromone receptor PreA [Talaromyces stipitatus ATCC 10500]|uniref:A-pheromone receptor PreA n=1 Tax=Talaromyces stipitatus (strain ATCC 10500 / CBS 375.48 / QM 6759 / NRRL 1006) TaxID=441959 RepID=B8MQ08_TALSN|nr:a-pheromone receptor PreA [Talaromyces stipitatus ATCC 10500]EED12898.1 a-pheromone receptor PreA [Talaromyces stipitatus ATCC 10500]
MDSYHRSTQAILAPVLSFLGLTLCIPPMVWHASNRNWGASFLVAYVMFEDLINISNALIWPTDDIDSWWDGAVFCDIQVKLNVATQVGMPGALLCVFRSLALAMDVNNSALVPSRGQRLRNKAVNVVFCIVLPVLQMVAHYTIQDIRYNIFAIGGCTAGFDESWPTLVFLLCPSVIYVAAAVYCFLIIIRLVKYTSEFSAILGASRSNLTTQRFIRLFGLSLIMILIILPLQIYILFAQIEIMLPLHPYSWEGTHGTDLSRIEKIPSNDNLRFERWIPPACSFLIFSFFGLGRDAANMYNIFFNVIGLKGFSVSFSSFKSTSDSSTSSAENNKGGSWYRSLRSKKNSWLGSGRA